MEVTIYINMYLFSILRMLSLGGAPRARPGLRNRRQYDVAELAGTAIPSVRQDDAGVIDPGHAIEPPFRIRRDTLDKLGRFVPKVEGRILNDDDQAAIVQPGRFTSQRDTSNEWGQEDRRTPATQHQIWLVCEQNLTHVVHVDRHVITVPNITGKGH